MCWKKMSYWLKGGIIAVAVIFILFLIGMIYSVVLDLQDPILTKNSSFFGILLDLLLTMLLWIPFLIIVFVIGIIIGWIYGKSKHKKRR